MLGRAGCARGHSQGLASPSRLPVSLTPQQADLNRWAEGAVPAGRGFSWRAGRSLAPGRWQARCLFGALLTGGRTDLGPSRCRTWSPPCGAQRCHVQSHPDQLLRSLRVQRRDPKLLRLQGWDTAQVPEPSGECHWPCFYLQFVVSFGIGFLFCIVSPGIQPLDSLMYAHKYACVCVCTYTYFCFTWDLSLLEWGLDLSVLDTVFVDHLLCVRVFMSSGPPVRRASSLFSLAALRLCCCEPGGQLSCVLEPTCN